MNILANDRVIAENYAPETLPPRAILRGWLDASGSRLTVNELESALRSGKVIQLSSTDTLFWRDENEAS